MHRQCVTEQSSTDESETIVDPSQNTTISQHQNAAGNRTSSSNSSSHQNIAISHHQNVAISQHQNAGGNKTSSSNASSSSKSASSSCNALTQPLSHSTSSRWIIDTGWRLFLDFNWKKSDFTWQANPWIPVHTNCVERCSYLKNFA